MKQRESLRTLAGIGCLVAIAAAALAWHVVAQSAPAQWPAAEFEVTSPTANGCLPQRTNLEPECSSEFRAAHMPRRIILVQ